MRLAFTSLLFPIAAIASVAIATGTVTLEAKREEALFMRESDTALSRMKAAMSIGASGDVDADFAAIMVAHHQGAIDMAQAELRYGRNEQLRLIAQEIIHTRNDEIAQMQIGLKPSPDAISAIEQ